MKGLDLLVWATFGGIARPFRAKWPHFSKDTFSILAPPLAEIPPPPPTRINGALH